MSDWSDKAGNVGVSGGDGLNGKINPLKKQEIKLKPLMEG